MSYPLMSINPRNFVEEANPGEGWHVIEGSEFYEDASKTKTDKYVVIWNSETGNLGKLKIATYYQYGG